jgi:Lysyl oxidase
MKRPALMIIASVVLLLSARFTPAQSHPGGNAIGTPKLDSTAFVGRGIFAPRRLAATGPLPRLTPRVASSNAGTLKNISHAVQWSGSLDRDAAPSGEVPECGSTPCDRFSLNVDLPGGVWNNKPGGVEVALRWNIVDFGDNLKLYVYKQGSLIAKCDGIIASAQSVLIPNATNGNYSIYVAFDQDSASPAIPYEALAEVEYPPNPNPVRPLLPDLVARPQRNVTFDRTTFDFFESPPAPGETCFPSEKAEEGAQTCLRFDQVFANTGEGPMEMRFVVPHDPSSPSHNIFQRIFRSDGGFDERLAGEWEFHPAHEHFHFLGFGLSKLWRADSSGNLLDSLPIRTRRHEFRGKHNGSPNEPIRTGRKVSFCLADTTIDSWLKKGDGPRTYFAPDCLFPAFSDSDNDYLIQGITQGWADTYDWYLPDQYIEVTGVPDGYYLLETTVDPDNSLLESDETNNCGSVLIRLSQMGTSSPRAELIRNGPPCHK